MSSTTLVLADDHEVARAGIHNALKDLPDVQVVGEAGNGPALFHVLEQHTPDCLLIDLTMPNFEPISAIRRIRAEYPLMKILVVSAYDDDVYVQGLLGLGVNGYHLKDQPLHDLRLAVQRVLAGERWVSSRLVDKLVRSAEPTTLPQLTDRQRDILRLLQQGLDNRHIAHELGLSVKTVENHLTRLYRQLDVQSRLEAVNYLMQQPQILEAPTPGDHPVLVVDDNARFRHQLCRMINNVNRHTHPYEAASIREALQMVEEVQPHLIFMDVVLGDESGIQGTRQIKQVSAQALVVLISAYPDSEFHRLGLEAGAVAFLDKKDLNIATLRQVIADVIP